MIRLFAPLLLGVLLTPVLGPAAEALRLGEEAAEVDLGAAVPGANAFAPPPESTGGFGESTCALCHMDGELNEEEGSLEIFGLPDDGWMPGKSYPLRLRLRHPALQKAGFQLTARFASGESQGEQAGAFAAGEGQAVQVPAYNPVEYLGHRSEGAALAEDGEGLWAFEWTAPAEGQEPVVFHAAANAADGDGSEWGDRIYTLEVEVPTAGAALPGSSTGS